MDCDSFNWQWLLSQVSYDPHSYGCNFCNCVKRSEKVRTSMRFEPVTLRFWCDALTNWAMKPLTLEAGHVWVLMFPWERNQWWNYIWNEPYIELQIWSQVSYDPWRDAIFKCMVHFIDNFIKAYWVIHSEQLGPKS